MALIQFTKNHSDHSTDKGYQFEFFCDRCGNGFMTEFKTSAAGIATGALRAAGSLFGGFLGQASSSTYEIDRLVRGPAHDKAFQEGVEEAKPNFRQCPKCSKWVCANVCWNVQRGLCHECAPNVETEIAAAQAQATAEQIRDKVRTQDLTKDLNLTGEAVALCPGCGARTQGGKFCPECGMAISKKNECSKCGTKAEPGSKFCPECGGKLT